jgi:hypothetical protein
VIELISRLFGARAASRVAPWLVLLALLVAVLVLGRIFHRSAPLGSWLFWRYAGVWLVCLLFAAACLSAGHRIVTWLSEPSAPRGLEHFVLSFAVGYFAFFFVTALVAFARGLGTVTFVLIPLGLLALGAKQLLEEARRLWQRVRGEPDWLSLKPHEALAFGFGLLGLAVIALGVLIPDNASYDTCWYHLGAAEHYAAAGGIVRSDEGNVTLTIPHLASIMAAWAFCLPWGGLFERYELAAHLELVAFLATLPGIVALVRYLLPGVRARGAWVALLLFPSVFVYDSSLHAGADHIAALWTIPAYLALVRAWPDLGLRACLLFAVCISGLLMTKYTAAAAAGPAVLALTLRGLYLGYTQLRQAPRRVPALRGLGVTLAAGLVLTAPHWLKNLIWYGDPFYPILRGVFPARPWSSDGDFLFRVYQADQFVPTGRLLKRLGGMVRALVDHSYGEYSWSDFHGTYPVFGSLFTFGLLALPFLKGTRRIWLLVLATHVGIGIWYLTCNFERYLQVLLPWMAAVVAGLAILAWQAGKVARIGVVALAALQVVWGADMMFWPLHRMTNKSAIGMANDFFGKGYGGEGGDRTKPFEDFAALGRALPPRSKVLVHHEHLHLGLGHMVVSDAIRIVYGLNYGELGSPAALHRRLREWGVTHVVWEPRVVYDDESIAGDLVFLEYVRGLKVLHKSGSRSVAALPEQAPREREQTAVVALCNDTYDSGIYPLSDLRVLPHTLKRHVKRYPAPRQPLSGLGAPPVQPSYAVINSECPDAPQLKGYRRIGVAGSITYYSLP